MAKTYYEVLGVEKDADADAIKNAWRRIRTKHHPDKGGDEDAFKEAKDAYDVLSDPAKRRAYDQFGTPDLGAGPTWTSNGTTTGDVTIEEILRRMREAGLSPDMNYQQRETIQKVSIPVDVMINGGRTQFRYANPTQPGINSFEFNMGEITLKPNTKVGTRVQSPNVPNTTFIFVPQGHHRCVVQGLDLIVPMEVNALAAAVGNKAKVTHPNGKTYEVSVPPGTKNGAALRLPKLGLPHVNGAVGNLIAVVEYMVPVLDEETRNALRDLLDKA